MSTNATAVQEPTGAQTAIEQLEYSENTGKRATHEAMDLVPGDGAVAVTNESHGHEADEHTYVVKVDSSGLPFACSCPADQYHDGACKHRVRCALSPAVLEAATPLAMADGGVAARSGTAEGPIAAEDDGPDADSGARLAWIVADTVPIEGDLPDFEEFRAITAFTRDSIERVAGDEVAR